MLRWVWRFAAFVGVLGVVAAFGASYEYIEERRDLAAAPPPGRLIDVGGHRLHLWCVGHGAPTVVFDSGLGGTAFDWYAVLRDVSGFTTACAYDRAGMGYSDAGPSPRTSRRIAGELAELVRLSETKLPVVLVGWSYGGLFIRVYAAEHESQVAGCSSWTPQTRTRRPNSPRRVFHPTYRWGTGLLPPQPRSACCG